MIGFKVKNTKYLVTRKDNEYILTIVINNSTINCIPFSTKENALSYAIYSV